MAQVTMSGLTVDPGDEPKADEPMSEVERMLYTAIKRLRADQPKAAMAWAVDAVNEIAQIHSIHGYAHL